MNITVHKDVEQRRKLREIKATIETKRYDDRVQDQVLNACVCSKQTWRIRVILLTSRVNRTAIFRQYIEIILVKLLWASHTGKKEYFLNNKYSRSDVLHVKNEAL